MISNDLSSTEHRTDSCAYTNPAPNAGAGTLSFLSIQKLLFRHRMWPAAATILYMILYYPVATILLISSSDHYSRIAQLTPELARDDRLATVSHWLGLRQSFTFMAVFFGAMLAVQGFSWLFSSEKTDFYNCQPFSAKQRFVYVFVSGILIFALPLAACTLLALLVAYAMDAMSSMILTEALIGMLRLLVLFFSAYGFSIFAVMLAGRGIYASIMAFIMLCSESMADILYSSYASTFLRTWYHQSFDRWPSLTPLYAIGLPQWTLEQHTGWYHDVPSAYVIREILSDMIPSDLTCLAVGVILLAGGIVLYRRRQAEYAGGSVIYRPARVIFLIYVSVCTALTGGILVQEIFSSGGETDRQLSLVPVISAAATAILTGAVVQAVYDRDLRRCFSQLWQHIVSAVAAVIIFLVFSLDLTGYDRYVPDASQVSDAAFFSGSEQAFSYPGLDSDGDTAFNTYGSDYVLREMKLTGSELDALLRVAEVGMETQRRGDFSRYGTGWNAIVRYHLKSGRNVLRYICIPYDIDSEDMDMIVGSDEYKQTLFPIYLDESSESMNASDTKIRFLRNGTEESVPGKPLYAALAAAYKKDLEKYDFSLAASECSIGQIEFYNKGHIFDEYYEVYPSFTNTIELLKRNGLYIEDFTADAVDAITVFKTDPDDNYSSWTANFTDKDQIQQILDHCERRSCTVWKQYTAQMSNYSVDISPAARKNNTNTEYNFKEGDIPQFVEDAMRPAQESVMSRDYSL